MDLELRPFSAINLADPFFDSLKGAYPEFEQWYAKKAAAGEKFRKLLQLTERYRRKNQYE